MKFTGTVKWFSSEKGYGFIKPDNNKKDVFIHISAVRAAGLEHLDKEQRVEYEITQEKSRESATNITLI